MLPINIWLGKLDLNQQHRHPKCRVPPIELFPNETRVTYRPLDDLLPLSQH